MIEDNQLKIDSKMCRIMCILAHDAVTKISILSNSLDTIRKYQIIVEEIML